MRRMTLCAAVLLTVLVSTVLVSMGVSATDNTDVVDEINITVPVSCSLSGTGMTSHNANIVNGTYQADIGSTTLKAFCNDTNGFAIYAAGYTGDDIGTTNSNKLVGTPASIGNIDTGTATSGNTSNWAMKLATDSNVTYAITLDNGFGSYSSVPNSYIKVAHRDSGTDIGAGATGASLTSTYAAFMSQTQPAGTYSGQVIYTLVHPSSAAAPVGAGKVGVTYDANGSTFAGGGTTNRVVYANSPMYIATTPQIAKSDNVANDGTKNNAYASDASNLIPVTASGASKMKVVVNYGLSYGTVLIVVPETWDGENEPSAYEIISNGEQDASGTETYVFDSDAITMFMANYTGSAPTTDYDYGFWAQVYPVYTTEQTGTEPSEDFKSLSANEGTYVQTTDWYGSWYTDINNQHYDFMNEAEITEFLSDNITTLGGTNIDLYRGLTFAEAYTRASKTQDGGYYKQQDLNNGMCQTIAITQNQTVKDIRDNNTYMIGKLKDGRCWMLDNLALDPTDTTTASNMNASNTNATAEAITNYLNGGSSTTGWSSTAVANKISGFDSYTDPVINNASKNTLVTSYGPASTSGQARVGIYYNFCAATVGTYCYAGSGGVDIPDTAIDAPQDVCPANWRMPTGGNASEYYVLSQKYGKIATDSSSLQYNLSTPLSGYYSYNTAYGQGNKGDFWSSTMSAGGSGMYHFNVYSTSVSPISSSIRYNGQPIRCLVSD